jgi:hypothetical protein
MAKGPKFKTQYHQKKKKEEGCFYSENPPGFITIPQCRVGREKVKSFIIGTLCTYCIIWEF